MKNTRDIMSNLSRLEVLKRLYKNLERSKCKTRKDHEKYFLKIGSIEKEIKEIENHYSDIINNEIKRINKEYDRYISLKEKKLEETHAARQPEFDNPEYTKKEQPGKEHEKKWETKKPTDEREGVILTRTKEGARFGEMNKAIKNMPDLSPPPKPVKLNILKRVAYAIKAKEKPWLKEDEEVMLKGILSREFLKYIFRGKKAKEKKDDRFIGETHVSPTILSYKDKEEIEESMNVTKSDVLNPYILGEQVTEMKSIISKKKPEIYKAKTLGYISNVTVRKISIYFIEKYPDFFKNVYKTVRYANIRVLANTYINIIFFMAIIAAIVTFPILIAFFAFQGGNFFLVILKAVFFSLVMSGITFWLGIYYPKMKAKTRRRSINTNLPFAIDHMSSVISSGVSPAIMFKLISNSEEYGEISVEIEKVSNYINFFGYDILTALKAIALTTPSQDFKEFIDGFVSTIETGGDLREYLGQKSSESLLNYKLERQKYVESLSTYSDIYTGVLIAAPLFFVTALSLVSVFGGNIGGLSVNTIIVLGTYVLIPLLNIVFLIFLEINQPEV